MVDIVERLRSSCEDGILPDDIYAAADEIERLRAKLEMIELQAVREIAPGWVGIPAIEWDSIMAEEGEQVRRLAEYRKDAERYRWLRAQHWSDSWLCVTYAHSVPPGCDCPSSDRLDEAIDAEMKIET
jgi:hypothetical protein